MNWVARAKEAILSVRTPQPMDRVSAIPEPIRWNRLQPLQAAINEALTGSPATHPVTRVVAEEVSFRRYLVIAETATEADEIRAAVTPMAPEAKATIYSLQNDRSRVEAPVSPGRATNGYDAAFVSLPSTAAMDKDALLSQVQGSLDAAGILWLHSWEASTTAPSFQVQRLLELMLHHVPSRWRASEALQKIGSRKGVANGPSWVDRLRCADFEIVSQRNIGGALLGPLLASGAISQDMASDPEGAELLSALYRVERMLIESGEVVATDVITIARPHRPVAERIRHAFEAELPPLPDAAKAGISGPLSEWIAFNLGSALTSARAADHAAPFPPTDLMYHTTGLQQDRDFAQHGADILTALSAASPKPLNTFTSMLDFGVGVGRVARYYKGFSGRYVGADIDEPNLAWVAGHLPWVETVLTEPAAALPFDSAAFDGVVSISVFTHIDRETTEFYVDELYRLSRPGALLFLTLHGDQALDLALSDPEVGRLVGISADRLEQARIELAREGFHFAEQYTHLTRANYRYGTTFASRQGAEAIFGRRFKVVGFVPGAIHAFQDLIVLERP
jgi:SAM-dependent methyltransferase